jgi:hypothetical protein
MKREAVSGDFVLEEARYLSSDSPRVDEGMHMFRITQHRFILNCKFYVCATCFGLYLGFPLAYHYKTLTKENTEEIKAAFSTNKFDHVAVLGKLIWSYLGINRRLTHTVG